MAKRYTSYSDLAEMPEGHYKPGGTMGMHHCTISRYADGGIKVTGSNAGEVHIFPGDTLGYSCGEVWRIAAPKTAFEKWRQDKKVRVLWEKPDAIYDAYYGRGGKCDSSWIEKTTKLVLLDASGKQLPQEYEESDRDTKHDDAPFGRVTTSRGWDKIIIPPECVVVIETTTITDPYNSKVY